MADVSHEKEMHDFHAELGYCFAVWTGIEMELLNILRLCLPHNDFEVVAGTFYAVDNFRSKLAMVDTALKLEMTGDAKWEEWSVKGGFHQRIIAASKKRNNLAHWMILDLHQMKKPPAVYMLPNIFKPSMKDFEATRPSGGYYVHDLKSIRAEFNKLAQELTMFWMEWRGPPEMLQELKHQERDQPTTLSQEIPTRGGK